MPPLLVQGSDSKWHYRVNKPHRIKLGACLFSVCVSAGTGIVKSPHLSGSSRPNFELKIKSMEGESMTPRQQHRRAGGWYDVAYTYSFRVYKNATPPQFLSSSWGGIIYGVEPCLEES